MYKIVTLQAGKEANVAFRHPWIFSGALASIPDDLEHGEFVTVQDKHGKTLGTGTYSAKSSIAVRVFAFGDAVIDRAWLMNAIRRVDGRRQLLGYGSGGNTTGYRVAFGESDGIPGLVVDRYEDVIVFQIATAGLDRMRDDVVAALVEVFSPRAVVERSDMPSRKEEGLEPATGVRYGEDPGPVAFVENALRFEADPMHGQKTGAFLDQKDLRAFLMSRAISRGREGLNLFSYAGATGVAAIKGGAARMHNVDGSEEALEQSVQNAKRNKIAAAKWTTEKADVFQWLGEHTESQYGMVIMDPPALIKSGRDVEEGKKAYHFLNRAAMRLVKDEGIFITSSCSHFLPEEDLAFILRRASVQAGVHLDILSVIRQSPDHPMSVYFPEAAYLKTFVCRVMR